MLQPLTSFYFVSFLNLFLNSYEAESGWCIMDFNNLATFVIEATESIMKRFDCFSLSASTVLAEVGKKTVSHRFFPTSRRASYS